MERSHFYKSMTSYADHRIWQDVYQYGSDKKFTHKDLQGSRGALEQGRKELTPIDSSSPLPPCPPAPLLPQRRDVLTERYWDVYHVPSEFGVLYIKFTADAVTEFLLLSFKEKKND